MKYLLSYQILGIKNEVLKKIHALSEEYRKKEKIDFKYDSQIKVSTFAN